MSWTFLHSAVRISMGEFSPWSLSWQRVPVLQSFSLLFFLYYYYFIEMWSAVRCFSLPRRTLLDAAQTCSSPETSRTWSNFCITIGNHGFTSRTGSGAEVLSQIIWEQVYKKLDGNWIRKICVDNGWKLDGEEHLVVPVSGSELATGHSGGIQSPRVKAFETHRLRTWMTKNGLWQHSPGCGWKLQ